MTLKVKKLQENAEIPVCKREGDAGMDLKAINITTEIGEDGNLILVYHSGIAVEIPEGYVGLIFPRSSIAKKSLVLTNSVGVIDSGYRGELMAKFKTNTNVVPAVYEPNKDYFAQLVIVPYIKMEVELTETLSETDRGEGGYGSTDIVVGPDTEGEATTEN